MGPTVKLFHCSHCGQRVFFENLRCESCGAKLGFVSGEMAMVAFSTDPNDVNLGCSVGPSGASPSNWSRLGPPGPAQRPCTNYTAEGVCNWMVPADDPVGLCVSCRTTHVIPALGQPENRTRWYTLEQAKRRVFYTLASLKLPVPGLGADPVNGVSFEFLEDTSPQQRVLTGHDEGVITLNIAEADDAQRERMRSAMREPYRTLVGHFRHELGHYYWDRLIADSPWLDECRRLFGDERADYVQALQQHYANPLPGWRQSFISVYASSHPWEDWAECWAHYLHMIDGLETAAAWGLHLDRATPSGPQVQAFAVDSAASSIEPSLVQQWLPITQFSNAMNRSLGLHDSYPFVVPAPVVAKLDFIHRVVGAATRGEATMKFLPAPMMAPAGPGAQPVTQ